MVRRFKAWIDRFRGRNAALPSLDLLLSSASPQDLLENRLNWLVDVVQWIRRPGEQDGVATPPRASVAAGRLRRFLDVLERNPSWKLQVARTLRSIIRETNALDLFSETGLPQQSGLAGEISERLAAKFLPPRPDSAELGVLFYRLFPHPHDEAWIVGLDEAVLERLRALLEFEVAPGEQDWNTLAHELEDAMIHLAAQLRVIGSASVIRTRLKQSRIQELPFFKLSRVLQAAFAARATGDQVALGAELNYLRLLIDGCHRALDEVQGHLEEQGVSTEVVYQLACIEASLRRLEALMELAFNPSPSLLRFSAFIAALVRENQARASLRDLLRQNFRLLTRKMVERNAETGEHYIARTTADYRAMLKHAAGGGVLMSLTTWLKTIIVSLHLPGLLQGLAASLNYSGGFVAIQLCGFTLATKQPAATAPALARQMHQVRDPKAMAALVDEVVCLIRSQFAAIVGNLALVVPTVLALHFLLWGITGKPILSAAKAESSLHSVTILGPSILFAALTGVLLWSSSLIGAWADNWFTCHRLGKALAADRRLIRVLGATRTTRLARFLKQNIGGFGSNISLGFMLGILPELAVFAGLPLDVRHVTLSSGLVTAAAASLGPAVLLTWPFWSAVAGILAIGSMNVLSSFSLAMWVAIRARGVQAPERRAIYEALSRRLREEPWSFLFPPSRASRRSLPVAPLPVPVVVAREDVTP